MSECAHDLRFDGDDVICSKCGERRDAITGATIQQRRRDDVSADPLKPDAALLCSLIVHADEGSGKNAHPHDVEAFIALLQDPDVQAWLAAMRKLALLPVKR